MAKLTSTDIYGSLLVQGTLNTGTLTTTGAFVAPLGTVSLPSYTFSGDLNTGIWSSGADTLNFSTNGAERLRIDSSGNIGIGITAPQAPLHVLNSNGIIARYIRGDSYTVGTAGAIKLNGSNTTTEQYIAFGTNLSGGPVNFTERMRMTTDGNLGIGTTTPAGKLHINGSTILSGVAGGNDTFLQIRNTTTNIALLGSEASMFSGATSSDAGLFVYGNNKLSLSTNAIRRLVIDGAGNVGIGTTSPSSQLEVSQASVNYLNGLTLTNTANWGYGSRILFRTPLTSGGVVGNAAAIEQNYEASNNFNLLFYTTNAGTMAEKLRIASNGNVGIGLTNPGSLLEVGTRTFGANFNNVLTVNSSVGNIASDSIKLVNATATVLGRGVGLSFYSDNATKMAQIFTQTTDNANTSRGSLTLDTTFGNIILSPNNGNVGIGTNAPAERLSIAGRLTFSSSSTHPTSFAPYLYDFSGIGPVLSGNNLAFRTGANNAVDEAMRITATRNVGIGTTTPAVRLDVLGQARITSASNSNHGLRLEASNEFLNDVNSPGIFTSAGGTSTYAPFNSAGGHLILEGRKSAIRDIYFKVGDTTTPQHVMTGAGNVGIGTTTPANTLHVESNSSVPTVFFKQNAAWNNSNFALSVEGYTNLNGFRINAADGVRGLYKITSGGTLGFATIGSDTPITFTQSATEERMRIAIGGNVGIGTATPSEKLHVNGTMFVENANPSLKTNHTTSYTTLLSNLNATRSWQIDNVNGNYQLYMDGTSNSYLFNLTSAGNLGIGTTTPGEKLEVAGNIRFTNAADRIFNVASTAAGTPGRALSILSGSTTAGTANIAGGNVNIRSGLSTGTASSSIVFQTPTPGVSGTTLNSLADRLILNSTGVSIPGALVVGGDLTVNGSTTIINSTQKVIQDPIITLGGNTAPTTDDLKDKGIEFRYFDTAARLGFFGYDRSIDSFTGFRQATNTNEVFSGTLLDARFNSFVGSLGAASLPSFTFTGDSNTGIWSSGADTLNISTNGAERLRVTSTGNVGIGTTNPSAKLTVSTTSAAENVVVITNGTQLLQLGVNNSQGSYIFENTATSLRFGTFNAERMRITSTGNVGIGTTTPNAQLSLGTSIGTAGTPNKIVLYEDATTANRIGFGVSAGQLNIVAGVNTNQVFYTNGANERMRITIAGNVGIGTNSPESKFDVRGSVSLNVMPEFQQEGTIKIGRSDGTSRYHTISAFNDSTIANNYLKFSLHNGTVNTTTDVLTLKGDGNVGIGTTSPRTKLHIENGIARTNTSDNIISLQTSTDSDQYRTGLKTSLIGGASAGSRTVVLQSGSHDSATNLFSNSDERLSLNPNGGNVGIGTNSPTYPLQLNSTIGSGGMFSLLNTSGNESSISYRVSNGATNTGWVSGNAANDYFLYSYTLNQRAININPTGNVGIGTNTSTVSEKLQVIGKTYLSGGSAAWNETTPGLNRGTLHLGEASSTANFGSAITFGSRDSSSGATAQAGIYTRTDGAYGTKMYIATTGSYSAGSTTRLMIDSNGRIGIGNTAPGHLLDVNGASRFRNSMNFGSSDNEGLITWSSSPLSRFIVRGQSGRALSLGSNGGQDQLLITTTGNVGIGTTSPGQKLEVVGNTKTQDLIISDTSNVAKATMTYDSTSKSVKFVFA